MSGLSVIPDLLPQTCLPLLTERTQRVEKMPALALGCAGATCQDHEPAASVWQSVWTQYTPFEMC